jgi:glycosyltransferase involved in cell wall biosynthesis
MGPEKNAINLIRALHIYHKTEPEISLNVRWVGKQDQSEKGRRYFRNIKDLVRATSLRCCFEWLGERSDIPELLREYDALILPSLYEGLPNAICEAFASGLPVLASNVCDNPLLVQHGVTGFLFEPKEPQSIVAAIIQFCGLTNDERREMGRKARKFAKMRLSSGLLVDNYEKLFLRMVRDKRCSEA